MNHSPNVFAQGSSLKRPWPFGPDDNMHAHLDAHSQNFNTQHASGTAGIVVCDEICFGSIIGVAAQVCGANLPRQHLPEPNNSYYFDVIAEGDFLTLYAGHTSIARLSKGLCKHLQELNREHHVRYEAYASYLDWSTTMQSWQPQVPTLLSVEIMVYGARSIAKNVGSILSKCDIYLQLPRCATPKAVYHNPHILRVQGWSDQIPLEPQHHSASGGYVDTGTVTEERLPDSAIVGQILDSLSHHTLLQETFVVSGIHRTLLKHQDEAIDFINRREMGKITPDMSLWRYNDTNPNKPFYQHVFTGVQRPDRSEPTGGIIADEMGLGKSLVILFTIMSSIERADSFLAAESLPLPVLQEKKTLSRATLILAPSQLLIDNWIAEIRRHCITGAISFHKHLGSGRHSEEDKLTRSTIVFTTYATVSAESSRGKGSLAQFHWFRIVLDEAHEIRNRNTKQFKAVVSLSAQHRWCLTGTPIQNSLDDLGALVTFLKVPVLERAPSFRKFIINPMTKSDKTRSYNLRILLQTICLRRTQQQVALQEPIIEPIAELRSITMSISEKAQYTALLEDCKREIDKVVSGHRNRQMNSIVLESLLRLRLFCNNGRAVSPIRFGPTGLPEDPYEALTYLQQKQENTCAYCAGLIYSVGDSADASDGMFMSCSHLVHHNCTDHLRAQKQCCPICTSNDRPTSPTNSPNSAEPLAVPRSEPSDATQPRQYPSKLLALLSDVRQNSSHKSIIFSCWKKTLVLVAELLAFHNIRYEMIDGSLSVAKRIRVLQDFKSRLGSNILLMTLGTGGVGLNLAITTRVYLLEPQWNPSIESQAIGRALRLGQKAQVKIYRYIMADTVEEMNVLTRQESKKELARSGFSRRMDTTTDRFQAALVSEQYFGVRRYHVVNRDTTWPLPPDLPFKFSSFMTGFQVVRYNFSNPGI